MSVHQAPKQSNLISSLALAVFIFYSRLIPLERAQTHLSAPCSSKTKATKQDGKSICVLIVKDQINESLTDPVMLCFTCAFLFSVNQTSDPCHCQFEVFVKSSSVVTFDKEEKLIAIRSDILNSMEPFCPRTMLTLKLSAQVRKQETITIAETLTWRGQRRRPTDGVADRERQDKEQQDPYQREDRQAAARQTAAGGCVVTFVGQAVTGRGVWGYFLMLLCTMLRFRAKEQTRNQTQLCKEKLLAWLQWN